MGCPIKYTGGLIKWQSFQQKNLSKQLVTTVCSWVDLTQTTLSWTQAILRAAEAKKAPVLIQTSMGAAKIHGWLQSCSQLDR